MPEAIDNGGTTDEDYRWKWLATLFTAVYGLGFPAWLLFDIPHATALPAIDGTLMALLTLVWLACVVYIVGPETVKHAKDLRA